EDSMNCRWPIVGLSVLALAATDAVGASAKQRRHGARHGVQYAPAVLLRRRHPGRHACTRRVRGYGYRPTTASPTRATADGARAARAAARPGCKTRRRR